MVKLKQCSNKEDIINGLLFVFGVFLLAMCYNLLLLPNNFVIGGVSGLAIVLQQVSGINSSIFIYIFNIVLLIICYLVLGQDEGKFTLIGSILYPLMITFTAPIANFMLNYLDLEDTILIVLISGLLYGFSSGLIFKCGFSIGGSDVVVKIISKYLHIPEGKATFTSNILIILLGATVFSLNKAIYSIIIIYIGSLIIDKIMFGKSNSKMFYIFTKKSHLIKRTILREFKSGFTMLPVKGGYSKQNGMLIMCVLPNSDYYKFKKRIMELDEKAFFIIEDCYESHGGVIKKNLPFM